jgi:hypothetical protein
MKEHEFQVSYFNFDILLQVIIQKLLVNKPTIYFFVLKYQFNATINNYCFLFSPLAQSAVCISVRLSWLFESMVRDKIKDLFQEV